MRDVQLNTGKDPDYVKVNCTLLRVAVAVLLCLVTAWKASAATLIWDGGGLNNQYDTVTNWSTDTLPVAGDTIQFGSAFGSGSTIDLNGNRTINKLIINTTTAFSITNSTLTLSSGDLTRNDVTGTEADQTIASSIVLGADGAWILNGSGTLEVSGVISGAKKITKTGSATLLVTGANTHTGGIQHNGGTLLLGNNGAVGTGTLRIDSGTVSAYGGSRTITNSLTLSSFTIGGSQDITFSGTVSYSADLTITVDNTATTTFSGSLSDASKVYKEGSGTLVLSGANAQNETYVNAGVLRIENSNGLGGNKKTVIASGGALELKGGLNMTENMELSGSGINGAGALRSVSGNNTNAGILTLKAGATIGSDANTLALNGNIVNGGFAATFTGAGTVVASGIISGTGSLTKNGTGTLTISGASANTYSGATTVNEGTVVLNKTAGLNAFAGTLTVGDGSGGANSDIVRLNADNQIPGVAVTVNSSGWLDLNNYSDTIGTLTMTDGKVSTGTGTLTLGGDVTAKAGTSTATISGNLDIGGNRYFYVSNGSATVDMEISAGISGSGWLDKYSTGRLTLSGSNSYAGIMYLEQGQLRISNGNALGTTAGRTEIYTSGAALELEGGIAVGNELLWLQGSGTSGSGALLNVSGNNSWAGNVLMTAASTIGSDSGTMTVSGNITNGGFLATFTGAGNVTASGVVSGTGGLTKTGTGTLTLSGNNTFTGALAVNAGTLLLGNNNRIADTVNMTLGGSRFSSGGYSETVGTLTLTANSIIDFGSGSSVLNFGGSSGASWTGGALLIITNWTGTYSGGGPDQLFFGSGITGLSGSQLHQIRFTDSNGNMQMANILANGEVVPVPEPTTWAGLAILCGLIGYRERRRLLALFSPRKPEDRRTGGQRTRGPE